jgi:uncharacterized DUF497 family protein
MSLVEVIWDWDEGGNVEHVAEHGLTQEDVEHVLDNPVDTDSSRSSGRPMVFGFTPDGRYIAVVFEFYGPNMVYPVTAYEVDY